MQKFRHITIALLITVALVACSGEGQTAADKAEGPDMKASAPVETAVATSSGNGILTLDSAGFKQYLSANAGKPTLAMLWATWCPSCKQEIPELEALDRTHGDKVNIIALSLDEDMETLARYLKKKPMALNVALADQDIAREHGVEAIPTLLIFDKGGNKIFGQAGVYPASMLEAMVEKLISE